MSAVSDAITAFNTALQTRLSSRVMTGPIYVNGTIIADKAAFGTGDISLQDIFTPIGPVLDGFDQAPT